MSLCWACVLTCTFCLMPAHINYGIAIIWALSRKNLSSGSDNYRDWHMTIYLLYLSILNDNAADKTLWILWLVWTFVGRMQQIGFYTNIETLEINNINISVVKLKSACVDYQLQYSKILNAKICIVTSS